MEYFTKTDSIIACATGNLQPAALAVIRISGPIEPSWITTLTRLTGPIEPKHAYVTEIIDEYSIKDEVVLTYFKGPNSYTGENLYEISAHGNPVNVERLINFLAENLSLRKAGPGEFTYRALKNKKMSLSQVEGLDLLLNAKSYFAMDTGLNLLKGNLDAEFLELRDLFLKLKTSFEINLDFSEDVGEEQGLKLFNESLTNLLNKAEALYQRGSIEPATIIAPKVVLYGKTNAGKSTLFNKLLKRNRAIVSDVHGTTRDYITEQIRIKNNQYELIDTAGLRTTTDEIEAKGIKSATELIKSAFFKIQLINAQNAETPDQHADLVLYTHIDQGGSIGPADNDGSIGANLLTDDPSEKITELVDKKFTAVMNSNPLLISRHRDLVSDFYNELKKFTQLSKTEFDMGILSSEVQIMNGKLEELLGQVKSEDVLENIFSNFCIGK